LIQPIDLLSTQLLPSAKQHAGVVAKGRWSWCSTRKYAVACTSAERTTPSLGIHLLDRWRARVLWRIRTSRAVPHTQLTLLLRHRTAPAHANAAARVHADHVRAPVGRYDVRVLPHSFARTRHRVTRAQHRNYRLHAVYFAVLVPVLHELFNLGVRASRAPPRVAAESRVTESRAEGRVRPRLSRWGRGLRRRRGRFHERAGRADRHVFGRFGCRLGRLHHLAAGPDLMLRTPRRALGRTSSVLGYEALSSPLFSLHSTGCTESSLATVSDFEPWHLVDAPALGVASGVGLWCHEPALPDRKARPCWHGPFASKCLCSLPALPSVTPRAVAPRARTIYYGQYTEYV
jgi:hypothetical protein